MRRLTLHVILRSTAKENRKPRPPFFTKAVCFWSVLRAAEVAGDVDLVFVNDGHITGPVGEAMAAAGEVVEGTYDLRGSYRQALDLVRTRPWPDGDLVYLCEDDHLHVPGALASLRSAAAAFPEYDHFGLYASVDGLVPNGEPLPRFLPVPARWRPSDADLVAADGSRWRNALSTTSTFAARAGALRADLPIHLVGHRTRGHEGAHDHDISLAVQGFAPYAWSRPLRHVVAGRAVEPLERRLKHGVWELALDALAVRNRLRPGRHRHRLLGAAPALACHLEPGFLATGTDWAAIAAETDAWARASGFW